MRNFRKRFISEKQNVTENKKKFIKENKAEDDANELYWKAQDIVLEGCQDIINKLQEYHKNGFIEDFYNLLTRIVAFMDVHHKDLNPVKSLNQIQNDAFAFAEETDEDDKEWLKSCIDDEINRLEIFNYILFNKIIKKY